MDSFDSTFQKAKDMFDIACKKTGEAVNVQKLRIDLTSVEHKLNKLYAEFGKLQFAKIKDCETDEQELSDLILDIKEKLAEVDKLKGEITKLSGKINCPSCGATLPAAAQFCSRCGNKIVNEENEKDKK